MSVIREMEPSVSSKITWFAISLFNFVVLGSRLGPDG